MSARLPFHLLTTSRDDWPRGFRATSACMWHARMRTLSEAFARARVWATHRWIVHGVDLDEILGRQWIERAWTFQEVILAPNPTIVCGKKTLSWEDLATYLMFRHDWLLLSSNDYLDEDPLKLLGGMPSATATSLESWRATIAMWLWLGSRSADGDDETTIFAPESNYERLLTLDQYNKAARVVKLVVGSVLFIALVFGLLFGGLWFVVYAFLGSESYVPIFILLAAFLVLVLMGNRLLPLLSGWWVMSHIIFGCRPGWSTPLSLSKGRYAPYYHAPSTGASGLYLEGIRVALRERKSTQPHDMVYSMLAILSPMGLPNNPIDYYAPSSECFQRFLISVVSLHPPALTMLCDAGFTTASPPPKGPSWVPNWGNPHSNPAVSSQFTIPARIETDTPSPTLTKAPYSIRNATLFIDGAIPIGRITFTTPRHPRPSTPESAKTHPIPGLIAWYHRIRALHAENRIYLPSLPPKDTPFTPRLFPSAVFASIESLSRPRLVDVVYTLRLSIDGRSVTERDVRYEREEWVAPINFADHKEEWRDFKEFKSVLDEGTEGEGWPEVRERLVPGNVRAERYVRRAGGYVKRVVELFAEGRDRTLFVVEMDGLVVGASRCVMGTGPAAAEAGDWVYKLPGVPGWMVVRGTGSGREGEYVVVGSALLPLVPDGLPERGITLV
ncbi:hypothetical protein QBC34DRAFT_417281, partial [Podospora aff. communis PSN243]